MQLRKSLRRILSRTLALRRAPRAQFHLQSEKLQENPSGTPSDLDEHFFCFNKTAAESLKAQVPHVSIESFVRSGEVCPDTAEALVCAFRDFGCVAVKDPRVDSNSNARFVEMMTRYFSSRSEMYRRGEPIAEMFPEYGYNTGVTPEFTERARKHSETIQSYSPKNAPLTPQPPPKDSKWRYMYPLGEVQTADEFPMPKVVPEDFPEFKELSEQWSATMLDTVFSVSQLLAVGLGLPEDTFVSRMQSAAHLLGPTGSCIKKDGKDTILAGFHYDFCYMTIHGKSNYPGLFIWLSDGTKLPVVLEDGYLLIQSGLELEMFTGGLIKAGMHEVVVTDRARALAEERMALGIPHSNWRVSSTVFAHVRHDCLIEPLEHFATPEAVKKYPPISALDLLKQELSHLELSN